MKFTVASLAIAIASFANLAVADNCTPGVRYCGFNLLQKGDYHRTIEIELIAMGEPTTEDSINNSLFLCRTRNDGAIYFMRHCNNSVCNDGGPGNNDYCG
ncbi:uncharacterized protein BDR25DRAFT_244822 [Lindgomyces ingoldianus]|uniref:Uncharacterized protein n=1 Tax=Lindgomyces ingoldianus TaxID=673940 RepID=A0ACB6QA00_9PLEO|nr:uncharacterized protein BDR25DRAFT_244822 [Lindgomyces ingoldianus]KAF2463783.1 hypothetical protein BDR25DRAFT_244822 [Lindgomyces ingoldianus]